MELRVAMIRCLGVLVLVTCALTGCRADPPAPSSSAETVRTPENRFAWITNGELTVRAGDRTIGPIVGSFAEAGNVFWTASGAYVGAVSTGQGRDGTLVVIDTRTGRSRRIMCGCTRAEPLDGNRVAFVDAQHRGRDLDLGSVAEPSPLDLRLPAGLRATEVMAAAGRTVLVRAGGTPDGTDIIFLAGPEGQARRVDSHASIVGSDAVGGRDTAGQPVFLISRPTDDGICPDESARIHRADGTVTELTFTTGPAAGIRDAATRLGDSWWDRQGRLNSMLEASECVEGAEPTSSSWWQWDDRRWTRVEADPLVAVRLLESGDRAEIVREDDVRVLYHRHGDRRTQIASEVLKVSTP